MQTSTSGTRFSAERRASRAIFSPTTDPIDPPMNAKFITPRCSGTPSSRPVPVKMASERPDLLLGRHQALRVVLEAERVGGTEVGVQLPPGAFVGQQLDVLLGREPAVVAALRADVQRPLELLPDVDVPAGVALLPRVWRNLEALPDRRHGASALF